MKHPSHIKKKITKDLMYDMVVDIENDEELEETYDYIYANYEPIGEGWKDYEREYFKQAP